MCPRSCAKRWCFHLCEVPVGQALLLFCYGWCCSHPLMLAYPCWELPKKLQGHASMTIIPWSGALYNHKVVNFCHHFWNRFQSWTQRVCFRNRIWNCLSGWGWWSRWRRWNHSKRQASTYSGHFFLFMILDVRICLPMFFSTFFFSTSKRRDPEVSAGVGRFGGRLGEVSHGQVGGAMRQRAHMELWWGHNEVAIGYITCNGLGEFAWNMKIAATRSRVFLFFGGILSESFG